MQTPIRAPVPVGCCCFSGFSFPALGEVRSLNPSAFARTKLSQVQCRGRGVFPLSPLPAWGCSSPGCSTRIPARGRAVCECAWITLLQKVGQASSARAAAPHNRLPAVTPVPSASPGAHSGRMGATRAAGEGEGARGGRSARGSGASAALITGAETLLRRLLKMLLERRQPPAFPRERRSASLMRWAGAAQRAEGERRLQPAAPGTGRTVSLMIDCLVNNLSS